jgi:hypothetical protein
LSEAERGYFEPRFGQDLSAVRLHTDRAASQAARSLGAEAFALGGDIAFAEGAFAPDTRAGRRVLAHELSHVVQGERGGERGAASVLRRRPLGGLEEREPFRDPRGRGAHGAHGTLPYREATRLADCIRILGESQAAFCRHDVLGEPLPTPRFKSLANITSPVPFAATVSARGSASVSIGGVDATFLPDRRSRSRRMRNRAETNFRFAPMPIRARTGRGRVTSFTGPGRAHVTIRTTYGPGARRTTPSAYGRGTTAADIAAGDTSLGFHEGRHGVDYVNFLENNAFPTFTGKVGMTTAEFRAAMAAFRTAVRDYRVRMAQRSLLNTDCVGTTIDAHNASRGRITTRCVVP